MNSTLHAYMAHDDNSATIVAQALVINGVQLCLLMAVFVILARFPAVWHVLAPHLRENEHASLLVPVAETMLQDARELPIDGQVFIRFCNVGAVFFTLASPFGLVLMLLYENSSGNEPGIFRHTITNVDIEDSVYIWWFVVTSAYCLAGILLLLLRREWIHFIGIRREYFKRRALGLVGESAAQAQFSVMVEQVPLNMRSEEGIAQRFERLFQIHSCLAQEDTLGLYHEQHLKSWEECCCCCPSRRLHDFFDEGIARIVELERLWAHRFHRAVDEYRASGVQCLNKSKRSPITATSGYVSSTAFVTFRSCAERMVSERLILFHTASTSSVTYDDWVVHPGPEARDLVWPNVSTPLSQLKFRKRLGHVIFMFGILVWSVPVAAIQALVSVHTFERWLPGLVVLIRQSQRVYDLVTGYLPVLVLLAIFTVLPFVLEWMAIHIEKRKTKSEIQGSMLFRYFLLNLATLYVTVFMGTVWRSLEDFIAHPRCVSEILGDSIPKVCVYFISFVVARLGTGLPLLLLRPLYLYPVRNVVECDISYEATNIALVLVLGLTYAVVAPVILPVCAMYFVLADCGYRWLFRNVYTQQFDCGGAFWYQLFDGTMIGMHLSSLALLGLVSAITGPDSWQAILLMLLFAGILYFHWDCKVRLRRLSEAMPYADAVEVDRTRGSEVVARFDEDYYVDPVIRDPRRVHDDDTGM